jgi:polysaccharide pyruvyl transferase CsaB
MRRSQRDRNATSQRKSRPRSHPVLVLLLRSTTRDCKRRRAAVITPTQRLQRLPRFLSAVAVPSIGISGSYGGLNRGDEAILTSMLAALRERLPDVTLTIFSRDDAHTRAHHDVASVVPVRTLTRDQTSRSIEPLDLLLLGGGGLLYDGEAHVYLREVRLAQRLNVATMAYAVGAGPLTTMQDRHAVREAMGGMQAVTVRDVDTKRTLEHAEVEGPVEVTADPALLLAPEPLAPDRLRIEGVPAGRALVGMSVRERGLAAPDLDADGFQTMLAHTADFVASRFDAEIVFIPMEIGDVRLSYSVMARMVCADHAHVLTGSYRPAEMLGLMEYLDLVIAMRLHVLVFAAVAGTPLFPLSYGAKVTNFIDALGLPAPIPVTRDSVGAMLAAVDRAWDLRQDEPRRLLAPVRELQRRAQRTLDVAVSCLEIS